MQLSVLSDYGATERIITQGASPEIVEKTISNLDWDGFHQVVMTKRNGDWLEVGGSLNPTDGLSVMYEEDGQQVVIKEPPATIAFLIQVAIAYVNNTGRWKEMAEWD